MKRNSQNLQHHLLARESNLYPGRRHPIPSNFLFHERNFYKSITPRLTVQNVDKPHGFLRKFSPNGKHLIVFSQDQRYLDVYQYMGVGSVGDLLAHQESECITAADHSFLSLHIRQELFNSLFKLQAHIPIITVPCTGRHFLNREFSLFLDGGNFVLLASMATGSIFPNYSAYYEYVDLYDNTELYDITFHLVDLRKCCVTDTVRMQRDFVVLSHNHCISLFEPTVAILSTYRQCIEVFIFDSVLGKLQRSHTVGPFLTEMDRDRVLGHLRDTNFVVDPTYNMPLSHLKQKILGYMYREILSLKSACDRRLRLKKFYRNFPLCERMIVLKMQLVDKNNLLLRFDRRPPQVPLELLVGSNGSNINEHFKLYVFYNITYQEVLKVFDNESVDLLRIVRNYSHNLRNSFSLFVPWHSSAPSTNDTFRRIFDRAIFTCPGGIIKAAVQYNPTIPINSQSFSTSPYLDYSLFDYDDRYISTLERPRLYCIEPIKFFDRETGLLKFRVFLEQPCYARHSALELMRSPRDLVTYIFHPYEPFFISIQKFYSRYVINFHLYSANTKTKHMKLNEINL